nr:hypothetical protein Iba_chr11dCG4960 [Ipomoea batatas]
MRALTLTFVAVEMRIDLFYSGDETSKNTMMIRIFHQDPYCKFGLRVVSVSSPCWRCPLTSILLSMSELLDGLAPMSIRSVNQVALGTVGDASPLGISLLGFPGNSGVQAELLEATPTRNR